MTILTIRTDQKISEVGLFKSQKKLEYASWKAHKKLSVTIHKKIESLLDSQDLSWGDIEGLIFYEGPGSFTGLRVGASVVNALASSLDVPAVQASGKSWIKNGIEKLAKKSSDNLVTPRYGGTIHITKPRK